MKILFVSEHYDPEGAGLKGVMFARKLQERGHDVQVLTAFPNYPEGRVYPGYRICLWQREELRGVPILRVPLYPSHDRNPARRFATYLSFALSASTLGMALTAKADVAYVYHPPGTIGLPLLVLRYLRRMPVVLDVQDLWPDAFELTGLANKGWIRWLVGRWMQVVYRVADHIVVLSPGFRDRLIERGVPRSKISVVYNWAAPIFRPRPPDFQLARKYGLSESFNLVFAGTMGPAQDIDAVLEAASRLRDLVDVKFTFFGGGTEVARLRSVARERALNNVRFPGSVPPEVMAKLFPSADALLIHLRHSPAARGWIPSKTQAYLAAGRPIISNVSGDTERLIEESGAGITVPAGDVSALAGAVRHLHALDEREREAMGRRAAEYYDSKLALQQGVAKTIRVLADVKK